MKYSKLKISVFASAVLFLTSIFVIAFFTNSIIDNTEEEKAVQNEIQKKMSQISLNGEKEKMESELIEDPDEKQEKCKRYIGEGAERVCLDNIRADKKCYTYTVEVNEKKLCKDRDFYFTAYSLDEVKSEAYNVLLESYKEDREFEYYNSYSAEVLQLKVTNGESPDEYVVVMRDRTTNKITAILGLHITEMGDMGLEYINLGGISPTSAAFKPGIGPTGITLEDMKKGERDLDAPFPKIDENGAKKLLSKYLKDIGVKESNINHNGYAILTAPHPTLGWYGINTYKHPFHEFIMNGEHFWVNGEDGQIFDEPRIEWIAKMNQKATDNPDLPKSFWGTVKYDPKEARKQK